MYSLKHLARAAAIGAAIAVVACESDRELFGPSGLFAQHWTATPADLEVLQRRLTETV